MNGSIQPRFTAISTFVFVLLALLTGCGGTGGGEDDWPVATPESKGLSTAAFEQAGARIRDIPFRYCFTVIKDGDLIHDQSYGQEPNAVNMAFSVTKTFMATLVGIAETQGYLSLDDRVSDWLEQLPPSMNAEATIRDVLGQVSQSEPAGSRFSYNTGAVVDSLGVILSRATGMPSIEFARQQLLDPLNMQYTRWPADSAGNAKAGAGIKSSCRDMARLGQLLLDKGQWQGQTLLSADYVAAMTQPAYPDANANYGYLTWLNWSEGQWHRPIVSGSGPMLKGAPANVYMATGFLGQFVIVIPDENMVITTMGTSLALESLNTLQKVWNAVAPAITPSVTASAFTTAVAAPSQQ